MNRPVGVDLFAGAGGLSLGFEQAGFDIAAAVEVDPVHAATYKFNFPECTVIPQSVFHLTGEEIRKKAGLEDCDIDVVFGGAPCQGFSLIGQRALDDPRNSLVREFVRLVDELGAKYFVFENVKGLTLGKQKHFLLELIEEFKAVGYNAQTEWKVLNAHSYGVPQFRERLFLLGARKGLTVPDYPDPITTSPGEKSPDLPLTPTCRDALGDLPEAEDYDALLETDEVQTEEWDTPSDYALQMRCENDEGWGYGYPRTWNPQLLTSSLRTKHTDISRRRFKQTEGGRTEPISRFYKLKADGVSNTLRAGTNSARGAFTSPRPIHYAAPRCVTVREMARLHGFPDWFRLHMTKWHGARQIGNAVPPPLARKVAEKVIEALGTEPSRPNRTLVLGDRKLIRMEMEFASEYWGVLNPIAKRNMKSGAKKRKQHEIETEMTATVTLSET